jgi:C4-dicarboxylate-specific signal transduction histidine kinase
MIMLNSRFSAVSSLAMYNSAIVHEISQPLQGLASVFDLLSLRAKTDDPDYIESLSHARDLLDKMAATLTSLRQLIAAHEPASDLLDLHEVVSGIIPIMRSEALRRGITLEWSDASSETASLVLANRILLERIVFNLVSNSFEALSGDGKTPPPDMQNHASPSIRLEVLSDAQTGQAIIRVLDNGPGFDIASPGQLLQIYRTSKNQGVGLGLALARIILETWRGELRLRSESSADWKGAIVEVRLPLASAPSHQG